jgi:hypothetical protein
MNNARIKSDFIIENAPIETTKLEVVKILKILRSKCAIGVNVWLIYYLILLNTKFVSMK